MTDKKIRATPQLVLGLFILAIGVLFTLDRMGIVEARDFLRFWPLAVIAWGIATIMDSSAAPGRIAGGVLCFIGFMFLMGSLGFLRVTLSTFWPVMIVVLGLVMIYHALSSAAKDAPKGSSLTGIAILGGCNRTIHTNDFRGGTLTAFMGGCEIDLRDAGIQTVEAVIHVLAIWGGIEIKVPETWDVVLEGLPILGGFEDRSRMRGDMPQGRLIVRGFAIMGGVEVRN